MALFLAGLDIGTTGSKAVIFSKNGDALSGAYREYSSTYPRPGWVEQDADLVVASAMDAVREAVRESGVRPADIAGISLSAQRCCGIFLDAANKLTRPMISWQDNRPSVEVKEIADAIDESKYYEKTGYPNSTTWLLPKILWVRKNEPEVWKRTARIVQMHDYFLKALGADDYFVDMNDAGFFGFFDNVAGTWDRELLELFNISDSLLPIPTASAKPAGKVSPEASKRCGLAAGTPFSIGAGDQSAGALGAGVTKKGMLSISMGTAGAVTAFVDTPFRDPLSKMMVTSHPMEGRWLLEGYQAAAASVYRWYKDEIGIFDAAEAEREGEDFYTRLNRKVSEVPAGAKGLLVLPYYASAATPRYNPYARGVILGLTFAHNRYDLARAFMEGISMDMKDMLNSIQSAGVDVKEARVLGGPTKSDVWNQIQSDMYGIPVTTLNVSDATVLGAAILGGVGAGIFQTIDEGADAMVRLDTRYEPDKNTNGLYEKLYDVYCRAYEGFDEKSVFSSISEIQTDSSHK